MKKILTALIIPMLLSVLFTGLLFTDFFISLDSKMYDLMLHIRPGIEQDEKLLIVDIDDLTIANINMYPLSRDIFADGLILMKEFDPYWGVLDIEFIDRSPAGINLSVLNNDIKDEFSRTFSDIKINQEALFQSLIDGRMTLKEAEPVVGQLTNYTSIEEERLYNEVKKVARDNDEYLARAISYFGNITSTVNMMDEEDPTISDIHRVYTRENFSFGEKLVIEQESSDPFSIANEIKPAIMKILTKSKSAGFPRVSIDSDGVSRRIDLIYNHNNDYYGQLGFITFWNMMGQPPMATDGKTLHLIGKDINIPLGQDGRMLINWPKTTYLDSFRHLSFYDLYRHNTLMKDLFFNLELIEQAGFLGRPYYTGELDIFDFYRELEYSKEQFVIAGDGTNAKNYRKNRDMLLKEIDNFLNGVGEQLILDDIDTYSQLPDLSTDELEEIDYLNEFIPEVFDANRSILEKLMALRKELDNTIKDSIAVLGYSGSSTTDIGVNPYEKEYMNVGFYTSVINTLMQKNFLRDVPFWMTGIMTFILAFLTGFIVFRLKPGFGVATGMAFTILSFLIPGAIFYYKSIYINILPPILASFAAFLAAVIVNLFKENKEKGFIKGAFSHYLSVDVISDLINDPSRLALGGEERELTAIFTDIKGFSTISEELTPSELVSLLNTYLTTMSDIIMNNKGTIDKYEGDAIISFFGAPLNLEDHAVKACISALNMKKAEQELNEILLKEGRTPSPIETRIGINTGPMVVGNMGTSKKMDYTIMGSDVNLAARLEGVNKQYGTQILISSATKEKIGKDFITRELDLVRVVGIHKPVTIHELCCFKRDLTGTQEEAFMLYHQALDLFRSKEWGVAEDNFRRVLEILPKDGPSKTFIERCKQYRKKPPSASWDGVYNLIKK